MVDADTRCFSKCACPVEKDGDGLGGKFERGFGNKSAIS
jgi:hypothetical protein